MIFKKILFFTCFTTFISVPYSCKANETEEITAINNTGKFYIDSEKGDDNNNGSKNTPWKSLYNVNLRTYQPNDSIFLKKGSNWQSHLVLKGSGIEGKPIVLTTYGEGNKPHIMANGLFDQVILLEDIDNWIIDGLEISNKAEQIGDRTGILIRSLKPGLRKNYTITNCHIHDIMGNYSMLTKGKNTGGIGVIGGIDTKFDNILIQDNEIGHINRVGVFTTMMDAANKLQLNSVQGQRPITNLWVHRNKIHHCTGDGAIIRGAYRPIISHNIAWENHNGPEELVKAGVALWCRSTDEALFEYNEVYNTRGSLDGQAFDADLDAYRTIIQYNYTHGNEGGLVLIYGSSSQAIVRYNISVNDGNKGKHIFDFPVWTAPRGEGIFHNNTVVIPEGVETAMVDEASETARFYNNIFYKKGKGDLFVKAYNRTASFKNNVYIGYENRGEIPDPSPSFEDPLMASPLQYGIGMEQFIRNFKLKSNSPYIHKGIDVKVLEQEAYWLPNSPVDIAGKQIPSGKAPIGALLD